MKQTMSTALQLKAILLTALLGSTAGATTLTVDSLDDTTLSDGFCTLREAITNANDDAMTFSDCPAGSGDDTINFAVNGTIVLNSTLTINNNDFLSNYRLTIDGGQAITVDGNQAVRVFYVGFWGALQLEGLTVANGRSSSGGYGGGVESYGSIHVNRCTFFGNSAAVGGALQVHLLFNGHTASISNSTFYSNNATGSGGAVGSRNDITISNSTFYNNNSGGQGGAYSHYRGTAIISNSTFTGNNALYGSAVTFEDSVTFLNSTLSGNTSPYIGGAAIYGYSVTLHNTIVSGNTEQGGAPNDIEDPVDASSSYNLIGTGGGLTDGVNGNIVGVNDPGLGLLADNGGLTLTMALLENSPAIDKADDVVCFDPPVNGLDQRGVVRLQEDYCDIGAYEMIQTQPIGIEDIIDAFNVWVDTDQLYGFGSGNSAKGRLKAYGNQLEAAGAYIEDDQIVEACEQIDGLIRKTNLGEPVESFQFIGGPAAGDLVQMLLELQQELGCGG